MEAAISSFGGGAAIDNILLAEDDPIYCALLRRWLELWGYKLTVVNDGAAAWRTLQYEAYPRLLLLDWMMPGIDGVEVCRRVRGLQHELYSYIVVITSKQEKQHAITALDAGADDYLVKPIDMQELRARVQVGRRILLLQDELVRSREQLRRQSQIDSLTGLLNRHATLGALAEELSRGTRSHQSTGILMIDVDRFKQINDRFGHQVGDAVLAEVAGRLASVLRCYDKIGRYGGEEFVAVLPNTSPSVLETVAERIRSRVIAKPFITAGGEIIVSVSIGGAVASPAHPVSAEEAIREADSAMYTAKNRGRNCCVIETSVSADHVA